MNPPTYDELAMALAFMKERYNAERAAHQSTQATLATALEELERERAHHDHCRDALDAATA
jgi:hypothetical protein